MCTRVILPRIIMDDLLMIDGCVNLAQGKYRAANFIAPLDGNYINEATQFIQFLRISFGWTYFRLGVKSYLGLETIIMSSSAESTSRSRRKWATSWKQMCH